MLGPGVPLPRPAGDVLLFLLAPSAPSSSWLRFSFPEQKKDAKPTKRQSLDILTRALSQPAQRCLSIFEVDISKCGRQRNCSWLYFASVHGKFRRSMNHGTP